MAGSKPCHGALKAAAGTGRGFAVFAPGRWRTQMAGSGKLGPLHARVDEVEPGLFKAQYVEHTADRGADAVSIPDSHISTSRDGVCNWVEEMAARMGYSEVIWE
jgi:hypothetical protein